jgi:hypothetical protein
MEKQIKDLKQNEWFSVGEIPFQYMAVSIRLVQFYKWSENRYIDIVLIKTQTSQLLAFNPMTPVAVIPRIPSAL